MSSTLLLDFLSLFSIYINKQEINITHNAILSILTNPILSIFSPYFKEIMSRENDQMPMPMSPGSMKMKDMVMHMNLYWGKDVIILFQGWPSNNLGMYILALAFVFLLSATIEVLSIAPVVKQGTTKSPVIGGLTQTILYALRIGLSYLVMLSVMSFNLGIFIVAVAGHAFGFFLVKRRELAAAPADQAVSNITKV